MSRPWADERGQSLVILALYLLFVGVILLAAMGVGIAYTEVSHTQSAADAAALAGARQALVREVRVGGHTVCWLPEIDPNTAPSEARAVWDANLAGTSLVTKQFSVQLVPASRPKRVLLSAQVESEFSVLGVVGHKTVTWPVIAEASVQHQCVNPLTGPVFSQTRPLPSGWGVPSAEWIWAFPDAERNAPTEWPVYFVRVFDLPQADQVTLYIAADADYQVGIDDQTLLTGSGTTVRTATASLEQGPHAIWVRASKPSPSGPAPFTGPNSAGLILALVDSGNNVLLTSQGNSLLSAGQPDSPDDWASWSPPRPDWTVYVDPFYPTGWLSGVSDFVTYLESVGFSRRSATDLAAWMDASIQSGRAPRTLTVMAQDRVPDTVAASASPSALIRQYLDAGGTVLWMGDVPFSYQGHADGTTTAWGTAGQEQILGAPNSSTYWSSGVTVQGLPAGEGYGIGQAPWWATPASQRALPPSCWAQGLASAVNGGVAAWRYPFWPIPPDCGPGAGYAQAARAENAPGFLRIFDAPINLSDPRYKTAALSVIGQLAGWYRGQAP